MRNIVLFLFTFAIYGCIWTLLGGFPETFKESAVQVGVVALLAMPFNINGSIWTIFGNAEGYNVYSVFSPWHKARNEAVSLFGAFWQEAGGSAAILFGFTAYQWAEEEACLLLGLIGYQGSEKKATTAFGMAIYQRIPREVRSFAVWSFLGAK